MIEIHGLHVLLNFLGFSVLFAFYGILISKIWLVPANAFDLPDFYARWRQVLGECLILLTLVGIMLLLVRTAEMDNGTLINILADLPTVLTRTHFGLIWALHLITLLLLWVCCAAFLTNSPSKIWTAFMVVGMLVLAFTYSATSHASDNGDFTFTEMNDWMHVISTSIWGGSIFISAFLIFPLLRSQYSLINIAAKRLSSLAAVALAFVLATGTYNSSLRLRNLDALTNTNYGRVLSVKLVFVGMLVLIGAFNRFVIISWIKQYAAGNPYAADKRSRLVFRALTVDAVFVLLAIIMAAILIQKETT
ncbi:MAG: CopD family protein [Gallionella sp.]